ncbi:hypothetical protein BU24DRAFT_466146 [Aaosphaeria arxii CBS 175.79]|uniref:Uncharacterized protein n=1 Tax=Aaosphaeria arxii CBS 175.79 TaxID=1450172 RepID=A0A6A5XE40_9PLEO|nr:uncharacterized protein BU24DRAFT_466146 [Aaosphaeria arxii CBS 175.79]KAF2011435.1 hypothetical protein BU24DRAFT_466146 [Aaosphaeria arxii CBS 175.79]
MSNGRVTLNSAQAQQELTPELRNDIYSALLCGTGIRNIESTLNQELQQSGWLDKLRGYMVQQLRDGEVTSVDELMSKVMEKLRGNDADANGTTNGVNGVNGHADTEEVDLKIPDKVLKDGSKVVRQELQRVCEVRSLDEK